MKLLTKMIHCIDALFLRFFFTKSLQEQSYQEFNREASLYDSNLNTLVRDTHASVDTKATAVLQHVSIMIAVSGLLYTQATNAILKGIFIAEMLLYVILTLFCLRLLMVQSPSPNFSEISDAAAKQLLLDMTAKLTFVISIALSVTVLVEVVIA